LSVNLKVTKICREYEVCLCTHTVINAHMKGEIFYRST